MKKIQILGPGCSKCRKLAENAETAARDLGLSYEIEKVTDLTSITCFGVTMTPALAVDGQVKIAGRVPSVTEIQKMLTL